MPWRGRPEDCEYPSLGFLIATWIHDNCVVPDGDLQGKKFMLIPDQRAFLDQMYRLRKDAEVDYQ